MINTGMSADWEKRIIRHGQILCRPSKQPEGTVNNVSYELGTIFQLDKEHCLLIASLDEQGGHDLCAGNDGFIFKKLSDIRAENFIKINRPDPDYRLTSGKGHAFLAKYPAMGGFIPLEEKLENGILHPAAGTGFCLSQCTTYSIDRSNMLPPPEGDRFREIIQIKWIGQSLTFSRSILPSKLPGESDLSIQGTGFGAVPKDTGLLFPFLTNRGIVTVLFEHIQGNWLPTRCGEPFITDSIKESEPSIKKSNGLYYLYTRGVNKGRLYCSKDGFVFGLIAERDNIDVPQVLNQVSEGSMYIAANTGPGFLRNPLLGFPVTENSFGQPFIIHDQGGIRTDEGDEVPFVDHAMGFNICLEGKRRHIITYRVCDLKERSIAACYKEMENLIYKGNSPKQDKRKYSGLYMAEIVYDESEQIKSESGEST